MASIYRERQTGRWAARVRSDGRDLYQGGFRTRLNSSERSRPGVPPRPRQASHVE